MVFAQAGWLLDPLVIPPAVTQNKNEKRFLFWQLVGLDQFFIMLIFRSPMLCKPYLGQFLLGNNSNRGKFPVKRHLAWCAMMRASSS
ncbi:MAG: hypothetical protein DCF32_18100 [Leptolyngbya sp.]|nr:MAG: hypothetical protein DCF32_18100 [Leptolyngbya sp.]